jgi:hypothetical protein
MSLLESPGAELILGDYLTMQACKKPRAKRLKFTFAKQREQGQLLRIGRSLRLHGQHIPEVC